MFKLIFLDVFCAPHNPASQSRHAKKGSCPKATEPRQGWRRIRRNPAPAMTGAAHRRASARPTPHRRYTQDARPRHPFGPVGAGTGICPKAAKSGHDQRRDQWNLAPAASHPGKAPSATRPSGPAARGRRFRPKATKRRFRPMQVPRNAKRAEGRTANRNATAEPPRWTRRRRPFIAPPLSCGPGCEPRAVRRSRNAGGRAVRRRAARTAGLWHSED